MAFCMPSERETDDIIDEQARELIQMHNDRYHPGTDCFTEDETGSCHLWTGKPAVIVWTEAGPICTDAGREWLAGNEES